MSNPYYLNNAQSYPTKGQQPYYETSQQPMNNGYPPPPKQTHVQANHYVGGVNIQIGGHQPIDVRRCHICNRETGTVIEYKFGSLVWIACLVLFLISICLFWIPFCIDDWKDK